MRTIVLLMLSNILMTFAWYGHLKFPQTPLFSLFYLKETFRWNFAASFGCMVAAVFFAFRF
jgi:uncharacterized protein (DUF486 family)